MKKLKNSILVFGIIALIGINFFTSFENESGFSLSLRSLALQEAVAGEGDVNDEADSTCLRSDGTKCKCCVSGKIDCTPDC